MGGSTTCILIPAFRQRLARPRVWTLSGFYTCINYVLCSVKHVKVTCRARVRVPRVRFATRASSPLNTLQPSTLISILFLATIPHHRNDLAILEKSAVTGNFLPL